MYMLEFSCTDVLGNFGLGWSFPTNITTTFNLIWNLIAGSKKSGCVVIFICIRHWSNFPQLSVLGPLRLTLGKDSTSKW